MKPNFDRDPDLVWYAPADNSEVSVKLNVPNDKGFDNEGVADYLYSTPNLTEEYIIGQRIVNDLTYTTVLNGIEQFIGERLVTFNLKFNKMRGSFSIVADRDVAFDDDNTLSLNRIVNGSRQFAISEGYILRILIEDKKVYQYSAFLDN